jgi:hypothetical protein
MEEGSAAPATVKCHNKWERMIGSIPNWNREQAERAVSGCYSCVYWNLEGPHLAGLKIGIVRSAAARYQKGDYTHGNVGKHKASIHLIFRQYASPTSVPEELAKQVICSSRFQQESSGDNLTWGSLSPFLARLVVS